MTASAPVTLSLSAPFGTVDCHFFSEEQIDFDLAPEDIGTEYASTQLLEFIRQVGTIAQGCVSLTPEGMQTGHSWYLRRPPVSSTSLASLGSLL